MQINIYQLLQSGFSYFARDYANIEAVTSKLGPPDNKEVYKNDYMVLHYGDVKFSFHKSALYNVTVEFYNAELEYPLELGDGETIMLSPKTTISDMLYACNRLQLVWSVTYNESKLDYLIINLASGVEAIFYLYNGKFERITVSEIN